MSTNTNTAQVLGVTPLEIYALKLLSHGSYSWQTVRDDIRVSLVRKGFLTLKDSGTTGAPQLTEHGRILMAALSY